MNTDNSNNFWWVVCAAVVATLIATGLVSLGKYFKATLATIWEILCTIWFLCSSTIENFNERRRIKRLLTQHYLRKHRSDGVVWTWTYDEGKVVVLTPLCEKDQGKMAQELRSVKSRPGQLLCDFVTLLRCQTCGYGTTPMELGNKELEQHVISEIERKIAAGEYLKTETQNE